MALDGFLADSVQESRPETGYRAWIKWSPASRLASHTAYSALLDADVLMEPSALNKPSDLNEHSSQTEPPVRPDVSPEMLLQASAQQALNELAMISFGSSVRNDGLIHVAHLPVFTSTAAALLSSPVFGKLDDTAELYDGSNPVRVLLSFLASLNVKDRDAFRLLAGVELDDIFRLLHFSGKSNRVQDGSDFTPDGSGITETSAGKTGFGIQQGSSVSSLEPSQRTSEVASTDLMDAERLLVSWRSSRLRTVKLQKGSLPHTAARAETGKHLAALLNTEYGEFIFRPGWAGENFIQDAKQDLNEAWSAIGRAVASDLRREAAPWLARKLGVTNIPAFNLEYTVRPSPANPFMGLMTMRAIMNGVSYGIPHQIAARALASAAAAYFDDATAPLRYVEEPFPGLRVYVPRDVDDASRAIAALAADLSAAYPEALRVPSILVHIPLESKSSCEEVCIALDGAYREAATGARLAQAFTSLLHEKGYPALASLILREAATNMEGIRGLDGIDNDDAAKKRGW